MGCGHIRKRESSGIIRKNQRISARKEYVSMGRTENL